MSRARIAIGALTLSAAALASLFDYEGWCGTACIPVPGDRLTLGFGSTDGVELGDTITPPKAVARALQDVQKFEAAIKQCVKVPLHQYEYDSLVLISYNIGPGAFCKSTIVKRFNAGDYAGGCDAFLMWNKFKGKELRGLTIRRERERALCLGH